MAAGRRDDVHTPSPSRAQSRRANANVDQARGDAPTSRRPPTATLRSAPVAPATRRPATDATAVEQSRLADQAPGLDEAALLRGLEALAGLGA